MRVVLGVDGSSHFQSAASLVSRLAFDSVLVDAVHCIESVYPGGVPGSFPTDVTIQAVVDARRKAGEDLLARTADELRARGLATATFQTYGDAAVSLMEYADEKEAGMIAVGSSAKGAFRSFFLGSVAKGLLVGAHQSLLVGKPGVADEGPVRAVFATDLSEYADACVGRFVSMAPTGLSSITVAVADPEDMFVAGTFVHEAPTAVGDLVARRTAGLMEGAERVAERLRTLGAPVKTHVAQGRPNDVVRSLMEDGQADLLVMGAQGKGFVERVRIGSVSFHQVIAEPWPVLVVRR